MQLDDISHGLSTHHFFDGDQVTYLVGHTTDDRGVLLNNRMADALKTQSLNVCAVVWLQYLPGPLPV